MAFLNFVNLARYTIMEEAFASKNKCKIFRRRISSSGIFHSIKLLAILSKIREYAKVSSVKVSSFKVYMFLQIFSPFLHVVMMP